MDDSDFDPEDLLNLKVILLGDSGVGKTSIICKYNDPSHDLAKSDTEATIGYEYIKVKQKVYGNTAQVHIWDTTGQDRFNSIASNYYRRAAGAVLVYDITKRETFDALEDWIEQLHNSCEEDVVLLIVGNKADKERNRDVAREEGEQFAHRFNAAFYETSAYTGYNVKT